MQSPLRYPGGKQKLYPLVRNLIFQNELQDRFYVEPFSGGYGIGINLLIKHEIPGCIINDLDYHIYAFWKSVFCHTKLLV